jgi:hypothetical protein
MKPRSLSNDSIDDITEQHIQICVIGADGTILSNRSPTDTKPLFTQNSFSFQQVDSCIIIQLSPMFLWKLTQQMKISSSPEYEVDFSRLRTFASFFMKSTIPDIRIYVYENMVSYSLDGKIKTIETTQYYPTLLLAYNYLYADARRLYNTPEKTYEILKECSDILLLLSDPNRDKRTYTNANAYKNIMYR